MIYTEFHGKQLSQLGFGLMRLPQKDGAIDKEQVGSCAIDILMNLIDNHAASSVTVTANNVVIRESVKNMTKE